jgi:NAD(P)-dependent dehydrogenase (short-subunit alcohol dehydrogenase family)
LICQDVDNIVIIGGTSGIGLSAALALAARGARVVALGLDAESCATAAAALGAAAQVLERDATQEGAAEAAIQVCESHFGPCTGLYHVAGGSGRKWGDGPLHELTLEAWDKTLRLNLSSLMLSNRAAVRRWMEQGRGGAILNLASALAYAPAPRYFATHAYTAAKSAIIGFSRAAAAYYAPHDIRVNVLAPGMTDTPMARRAMGDENILAYVRQRQRLDGGRPSRPSDLDGAALYFLTEAGRFTTGQVLGVEGGWELYG